LYKFSTIYLLRQNHFFAQSGRCYDRDTDVIYTK